MKSQVAKYLRVELKELGRVLASLSETETVIEMSAEVK